MTAFINVTGIRQTRVITLGHHSKGDWWSLLTEGEIDKKEVCR